MLNHWVIRELVLDCNGFNSVNKDNKRSYLAQSNFVDSVINRMRDECVTTDELDEFNRSVEREYNLDLIQYILKLIDRGDVNVEYYLSENPPIMS